MRIQARQSAARSWAQAALLARIASRDPDSFAAKMLAAMRNQFGGHEIKKQ